MNIFSTYAFPIAGYRRMYKNFHVSGSLMKHRKHMVGTKEISYTQGISGSRMEKCIRGTGVEGTERVTFL